jgi:hypothetical protein
MQTDRATCSASLQALLGVRPVHVIDVAGAYVQLLRQRYESDPRFRRDRPFKEPTGLLSLPKLVQTLKAVPYSDAFRQVLSNPRCVNFSLPLCVCAVAVTQ